MTKYRGAHSGKHGPELNAARVPVTPERMAAFLETLRSSGGCFAAACRRVSPHSKAKDGRPTATTWKKVIKRDARFAADVAEVMDAVREDISAEIFRRGQVGYLQPVYQKGQRVMDTDDDGKPIKASIRQFSDHLLLARARAMMPEYADKRSIDISGTIQHQAGGHWTITRDDMDGLTDGQVEQLTALMMIVRGNRGESQEVAAIEHKPAKTLQIPMKTIEGESEEVKVLASPVAGSAVERDYVDDESEQFPPWDD